MPPPALDVNPLLGVIREGERERESEDKSKRKYEMPQTRVIVYKRIFKGHMTFHLLNPKFHQFIFASQSILVPSLVEIHSVVHKLLR